MIELPWSVRTDDNLDIAEARAVLDADHEGLEDVKDRILEYLAVRKLRQERGLGEATGRGSGAILTLVGPPGVGKTSLGESVARALGRKFVRVSLGGIHDEAEIRGHRRTYVGALPGRIVRALKDAGTKNPVMMLDEIDKVGADWRGDPSSALLEVLDPAQNHTFRDHYLDVDLDLSEVLFITTANVAETIPGPLFDRMEVIRIDGYTEDEKVAIAKHHLVGASARAQRPARGRGRVHRRRAARRSSATTPARPASATSSASSARRCARSRRRSRPATSSRRSRSTPTTCATYLGRQKFFFEAAERTAVPGVATGLAVTGIGGDVLFIEATPRGRGDGRPDAHRPARRRDEGVGADRAQLRALARGRARDRPPSGSRGRFHVHVPAGAVPKDGPSAGVTMTTALVSLLTGHAGARRWWA